MNASEGRHRRSIRLPGYDYATAGAYFVTICAYQRLLLFENTILADIIKSEWRATPTRFPTITLDAFVLMPNHIHFVVFLNPVGAGLVPAPDGPSSTETPTLQTNRILPTGDPRPGTSPAPTLGSIVGAFKSRVAVRWLAYARDHAMEMPERVWQRNYYERVIRDETELYAVREYIRLNPTKWLFDSTTPTTQNRAITVAIGAGWKITPPTLRRTETNDPTEHPFTLAVCARDRL